VHEIGELVQRALVAGVGGGVQHRPGQVPGRDRRLLLQGEQRAAVDLLGGEGDLAFT
jgi:hypothetical protein